VNADKVMPLRTRALLFALTAAPAGCAHGSLAPLPTSVASGVSPQALSFAERPLVGTNALIQHVVIIVQENRTPDNLFNGLPGADTVRSGKNSHGQVVELHRVPLATPYTLVHSHPAFKTEYADGHLNGFDEDKTACHPDARCPAPGVRAYGYVTPNDVKPYLVMAERFTFADHMFQTNQGPSFPAHQYILSGTSTITNDSTLRASENVLAPRDNNAGGCDSPPGSTVAVINLAGKEDHRVFPCFSRVSLPELLAARGLSWRYYQAHLGAGTWHGPDAILQLRKSPEFFEDVVAPPGRVLTDIADGQLANVVWVTPTAKASDHSGLNNGSGPSWVASVVNAVGESQYWNDTAIFITWDDWGGWYDHVRPTGYNSYELGFRVPLIVVSPYAKRHFVSHRQHEFGSILKFVEETFGLSSLGTTDVRADNLSDCFDFSAALPHRFQPIPAPLSPSYFLKQPISMQDPDDD
jgi:phospholipase C